MTDEQKFLSTVGEHYDELKTICKEICKRNREKYSDDIFQDTIIKIAALITKKGCLKDMTTKGIMNYFTRSFVNNLRCEKRYAYVAKRDHNITTQEMNDKYELQHNHLKDKLIKDLFEDFSILYIMHMVEENFSSEGFYLYRLKTLCGMTYKQIYDKTKIKKSREQIVNINNWVKNNISKQDILKVFNNVYGNLID